MSEKIKNLIYSLFVLIVAVGFIIFLGFIAKSTMGKTMEIKYKGGVQFIETNATAYCDVNRYKYNNSKPPIENMTLIGKREWIGKTAMVYNQDFELLGIYIVTDTGYGWSTGRGESEMIPGRPLGTIESGDAVDIYVKTEKECSEWGIKRVYIQLLDGKG